ncbi:putative hydrolase [Selenomonas ruminantium subsp. lactilytica TAM6421]|uniref:Putative hydrolase n=1 Tax=Selenomonas ruminantium subsp. lactilytica (strain NBRC 103574 / TAM6421) TaxID=927704 RepID=I0GSX5_SELRL|nr:Cof-type HAD-IIB family hydrolase [Selenomonas ruminantium]BAL83862.1 putative hydrolase [Selenomonas ruminantium subsp. lactilytica TAM6421]
MSNVKIVFSDIDGTVLTSQHEVTSQTKDAVKKLVAEDIPFVLVSARMPEAIYPITEDMGIKMPIICYSGAYVLDREGQELASDFMEAAPVRQLLGDIAAAFPKVTVNFYSAHHWYVTDKADARVKREEDITSAQAEQADFDALLKQGILPHKILLMAEPADCAAAEKYFQQHYPQFQVARSSDILLEIMDGKVSKAAGIAVLLQHYGFDKSEALSFGDNYNDLAMLEYTGMSVAMGNAPDDVKAVAKAVTASNNDSGIAVFLAAQKII